MPSFFRLSFLILSLLLFELSSASHLPNGNLIAGLLQPRAARDASRKISRRSCRPSRPALVGPCFPALGFQMPSDVPANMTGWWCNPSDEYGFLGFSYEVTSCEFLHLPPYFSGSSSVYHHTLFLQVKACPSYKRISRTSEIPSTVGMFACMGHATTVASSRHLSSQRHKLD